MRFGFGSVLLAAAAQLALAAAARHPRILDCGPSKLPDSAAPLIPAIPSFAGRESRLSDPKHQHQLLHKRGEEGDATDSAAGDGSHSSSSTEPARKRRGRPPKQKDRTDASAAPLPASPPDKTNGGEDQHLPKRRRGPPKQRVAPSAAAAAAAAATAAGITPSGDSKESGKRQGRSASASRPVEGTKKEQQQQHQRPEHRATSAAAVQKTLNRDSVRRYQERLKQQAAGVGTNPQRAARARAILANVQAVKESNSFIVNHHWQKPQAERALRGPGEWAMYERLRDGAREYQRTIDWRRRRSRQEQQRRQQQQQSRRQRQPEQETAQAVPGSKPATAAADEAPEEVAWEKRWQRGKEAKRLLIVLGREVARRLGALVTATGGPAPQWDELLRAWPEIQRRWDTLDRELAEPGAAEQSAPVGETPSIEHHRAGNEDGQLRRDDGVSDSTGLQMSFDRTLSGLGRFGRPHAQTQNAAWSERAKSWVTQLGVLPSMQGKTHYQRPEGASSLFLVPRKPLTAVRIIR